VKEKLEEIYDGLKERLKSPFLMTFLLVWSIQNWEFMYMLLTFDSEMTFEKRILYLKVYLMVRCNWWLIWRPLLWTFGSMGLYFIGVFISEGINLIYAKWIRAWLYFAIDRNKLKTQDDYDELENRRKNLQDLVFDLKRKEEDAAIKLKNTEQTLNREITELRIQNTAVLEEKNVAEKQNEKKEAELEGFRKSNEELTGQLEKSKFAANAWEINANDLKDFKEWVTKLYPDLITKYENRDVDAFNILAGKELTKNRFRNLFKGTWLNTYEHKNGTKGQEMFSLFDEGGQLVFKTTDKNDLVITDIVFHDNTTLEFTKTNKKVPNAPMKNKLRITNSELLVGTENNTIDISYSKIAT